MTTAVEPFDVILLDCRLTDSEDLRLLADLRRTSPGSAIIFMTAGGYATAAVVDAARTLAACRALTKPVDVETIGNVVLAAHYERTTAAAHQAQSSREPGTDRFDAESSEGRSGPFVDESATFNRAMIEMVRPVWNVDC